MKNPVTIRRFSAFVALAAAIFGFVRMQQVGDWYAVPLWMPYAGESISGLPLRIQKDGFYLVQLEIYRNAKGEDIQEPTYPPLDCGVSWKRREIGTAHRSGWYAQDAVCIGYYGFPAVKGRLVQLDVKPSATLSNYKSHRLHLVVQRDDWDYGLFLWREFGWLLLAVVFFALGLGLAAGDLRMIIQSLLPSSNEIGQGYFRRKELR